MTRSRVRGVHSPTSSTPWRMSSSSLSAICSAVIAAACSVGARRLLTMARCRSRMASMTAAYPSSPPAAAPAARMSSSVVPATAATTTAVAPAVAWMMSRDRSNPDASARQSPPNFSIFTAGPLLRRRPRAAGGCVHEGQAARRATCPSGSLCYQSFVWSFVAFTSSKLMATLDALRIACLPFTAEQPSSLAEKELSTSGFRAIASEGVRTNATHQQGRRPFPAVSPRTPMRESQGPCCALPAPGESRTLPGHGAPGHLTPGRPGVQAG
jgi:hypothetical protein